MIGEWGDKGMHLFFLPLYCPQRYAAPAKSDRDNVEEGQQDHPAARLVVSSGFRK